LIPTKISCTAITFFIINVNSAELYLNLPVDQLGAGVKSVNVKACNPGSKTRQVADKSVVADANVVA
jgi:hypothetical protein